MSEHSLLSQDAAWIEVIQKMDETYADLVRYQTELEEKNAALEEARRFILSVQAAMTDVLIVCDAQGQVQQANRALEVCTDRSEANWIGQPLRALFTPASQAAIETLLRQAAVSAIRDQELTLQGKAEGVLLALNCSPRRDRRGRLMGFVLLGRPIGELKQAYESLHRAHQNLQDAQQRLISSEKMASLGRLVAGVAHELNNPISFVYGNMFALQRYGQRLSRYCTAIHAGVDSAEREQLRSELRIDGLLDDLDSLIKGSLEGAERIRTIVEDLRRYSSTRRGDFAEFDLVPLVHTALDWVLKGNQTELATTLDLPTTLSAYGDAGQIHQVIMNLVQNALDAMQESAVRHLEIRAGKLDSVAGEGVWMTLRDTGHGIAPQHVLQIFDPFFTTKPAGQGTGLGLAISYRTVSEHGGKLEASNHPQGGVILRLELPTSAETTARTYNHEG